MTLDEAISTACSNVGIKTPRSYKHGQWAKCDTLDGKSGKGDGRLKTDDMKVVGWNWKTGEKATVWLKDRDSLSPVEKKQFAERKAKDETEQRERAARAAHIAVDLIAAAKLGTHPYLARKGFPAEQAHILSAAAVCAIGGSYLVAGAEAIVIPARIGPRITSAQLIWEDGTKKFLAGGLMERASHRIGTGAYTWLVEGYATGLSVRAALQGLKIQATILCCFSASNILAVSRQLHGRVFVAADHDKPLPQFDGLGTGEHFARATGLPYCMPPEVKTDFNDLHLAQSIFAVQRVLTAAMARRAA